MPDRTVDYPLPGAGELDKRVEIRRRVDSPMGVADIDTQYQDTITRWASLKPVGTAVWSASVQTDERVTHRCVIRYMDGITDHHEVVHRHRVYRVRRAAPLQGKTRFLVLEVEELGEDTAI